MPEPGDLEDEKALQAAYEALDAERLGWRKVVGFVVAACRTEQGLTQPTLGKLIGKSRGWVAKFETGRIPVDFGELMVIADKLQIERKLLVHRILNWSADSTSRA